MASRDPGPSTGRTYGGLYNVPPTAGFDYRLLAERDARMREPLNEYLRVAAPARTAIHSPATGGHKRSAPGATLRYEPRETGA